eukprot:g13960.t1
MFKQQPRPAVRKATKRKAASPRASEEATKKAKEHGEEMAAPKLAAPPVVSTRKRGKQPDSARTGWGGRRAEHMKVG